MSVVDNMKAMWVRLLQEDPASRKIFMVEIHAFIQRGEIETAKQMLRTLIETTCGFPTMANEMGSSVDTILYMLSPDTDPGIKAFMAMVKVAERQT